jgi:hypothetical protein
MMHKKHIKVLLRGIFATDLVIATKNESFTFWISKKITATDATNATREWF